MDPTTMDPAMLAFLEAMGKVAATQDLSENKQHYLTSLTISFAVLAAFFVILRFVSRAKTQQPYKWDDWLIVIALALIYVNLGCMMYMIKCGLGKHSGALTLDDTASMIKALVAFEVVYTVTISLVKISLLMTYMRMFPVRRLQIGAYILIAVSLAWTMSIGIAAIFQCTPRRKLWQPWLQGTCLDAKKVFLGISFPNIVTDIAILTLPIPILWGLQTTMIRKLSLTVIFLLGSFVVFTSVYRFVTFLDFEPTDLSWTIGNGFAWSFIETCSGIISTCLPIMGPILRIIFNSTGLSGMTTAHSNATPKEVSTAGRPIPARGYSQRPRANFTKLTKESEQELRLGDQNGDYNVFVSKTSQKSVGSGDEIPLTDVHIRKDVEWREERVS